MRSRGTTLNWQRGPASGWGPTYPASRVTSLQSFGEWGAAEPATRRSETRRGGSLGATGLRGGSAGADEAVQIHLRGRGIEKDP